MDFVVSTLSFKVELLLAFARARPSQRRGQDFLFASPAELLHLMSGQRAGYLLFLPNTENKLLPTWPLNMQGLILPPTKHLEVFLRGLGKLRSGKRHALPAGGVTVTP